jgi:hypothetical protein
MTTKRLYLWRSTFGNGHRPILKQYRPGVAVTTATSEREAWDNLRATDERAYWQLKLGHWYITDQADYDRSDEDDRQPRDGAPFAPEAFDLEDFPTTILTGGE